MLQRLPLAGLPATPAFTRDYISDFARMAAWFDYDPHSADSFALRLAELDAREWQGLADSARLAAEQQQRWGGDALAVDNARALGEAGTYMVVTGQQPGLFGGPLYSQLKALSAVLLARKLAAQFPQRRFVPVFWIASADSDFDEVSRTTVVGGARQVQKFALRQERSQDGRMLNRREVTAEQLAALIADLAQDALPQGLYRADVLTALSAAYCPPDESAAGSLVRGFARWMQRLFQGTGLVVIEPDELIAQRPDIGAIYAAQLTRSAEASEALAGRGAELEAAGYRPQAEAAPEDTHVFLLDEQGFRDKLIRSGAGALEGKRSGRAWSTAELAELAQAQPERFTGSVLFRPVVEDALFPAAAWIGGSAELAYRAQCGVLFALHGRKHAPAFLRHHATALPAQLAAALDSAGGGLDSLPRDAQDWRRQVAARETAPELRTLLAELKAANARLDELIAQLPRHLPELERSMQVRSGKADWLHRTVTRKVNNVLLRRQSEESAGLLRAQAWAFPLGEPQERVLNLLSILPRAGFGIIPRLLEELDAPCWEHCLIMYE